MRIGSTVVVLAVVLICCVPAPAANETLVEVTRRIYTGELKPDPANLRIALELLKSKTHRA